MMIDPVYFGVLSWFMGRSDVNAAEILGRSTVPFQIIGLLVSVVSIRLVLNWRQEARQDLYRYRLSDMEYPSFFSSDHENKVVLIAAKKRFKSTRWIALSTRTVKTSPSVGEFLFRWNYHATRKE